MRASEASGEAAFWHGAYREHAGPLLAFLHHRLRRREDAEDALHETFFRAIRSGGRLREAASVRAYLFTIAHRICLNHYRRRRERLFSEDDSFEAAALALEDGDAASPEAAAIGADLASRLRAVMAELPDAQRLAFEEGVLRKRPYQEIAGRTGWSLSQVKTNVFRARRRILAVLGPELEVRGSR